MCVYLCVVYVHVCADAQRGHEALDPPGPGLTGGCGASDVSAGNLARLLMKQHMPLTTGPSLQPQITDCSYILSHEDKSVKTPGWYMCQVPGTS